MSGKLILMCPPLGMGVTGVNPREKEVASPVLSPPVRVRTTLLRVAGSTACTL